MYSASLPAGLLERRFSAAPFERGMVNKLNFRMVLDA